MFSFHKNDALPRSRQSSIDAPVTGPSTFSATSNLWTPPGSGPASHATKYSPEQQHKAYSIRRNSVFNLRSRSNTATSATPSLLSLSHPAMTEHEASLHESSPGFRLPRMSSQMELSGTGARRSLFRGKKGKRLSETVGSSIGVVDSGEGDAEGKRTSLMRKGRRQHNLSEGSFRNLRHRISSPFDFQHVTHTDRHQFAALEKVSSDKLAAGLWAGSTSQPPSRDLTGIRADNLHFSNFSSENLGTSESRSTSALSFGSPPRSPDALPEWQQSDSAPQAETSNTRLRLSRSVESFSQPSVNLRSHHHSQSVIAPPRFSSLLPLAPIHDGLEVLVENKVPTALQLSSSNRESDGWDSFALEAAISPAQLPGIQAGSSYFGHALTTPDDSAIHAMTPPFSPSLEDVAEEPERFVSPRPAPQPPLRIPTTPKSPNFESFAFNTQRSPMARARSRGNSQTSPKTCIQRSPITRPIPQIQESLGLTSVTCRGSTRRPYAIRRRSNTWRAIEESWEDDVDYIYENALEADCEFEWDRVSNDGPYDSQQPNLERAVAIDTYSTTAPDAQTQSLDFENSHSSHAQFPLRDFRTSLLLPGASHVPELVPTSAFSFSTTGTGLATPSDPFNTNRFTVDEEFTLSPSLLLPQEYKDTREASYEELLQEYDGSDRHFPMLDANQSTTNSARSSHVRSSRRSSYDSSLVSSAQSSGLWSSSVRRSASSAGSVPELVPSRRTRKELSFSLVVDKLSEQVASLDTFEEGKEDNDITPPGRFVEGQAFFASGDEAQQVDRRQGSIESELKDSLEFARHGSRRTNRSPIDGELKTSLDLVRQGSQCSTQARCHKQALSDGAAKLLAKTSDVVENQPTKSRNRAATTTHARQPMLSLFPTARQLPR